MKLLDVVATMRDLPERQVTMGQVGTVVEVLDVDNVLVEFAGPNGVAYAIEAVPVSEVVVLKQAPGNVK